MSIKSQKSLMEECSEIIERSYSVYSDDSLSSCSDDDEALARELMNKLTPAAMSQLRRRFRRSPVRNTGDIDRRVQEVMRAAAAEEGVDFPSEPRADADQLWLDLEGFVSAVNDIFGHHKYSTHAQKLSQLLDPFGSGRVRWRPLVERLVAAGARRTAARADTWRPLAAGRPVKLDHCKRETIVKLVDIERPDWFCYAAVSRGGRVGVYSGLMELIYCYQMFYHRTGTQRRVRNCWVTDCIYLDDVQYLMISASDRSLTVYDVATLTHTLIYCITGLPNIPTCLSYSPTREGTSELAVGTERGDIIRLVFLQPRVSLFYTKTPDHVNYYFWMELTSPPHTSYCAVVPWRRVHCRSVRRVAYVREGQLLASCSHDAAAGLRVRHVAGKMDDCVFKVPRGVTCFHLVPSSRLAATGGPDGARLWDSARGAAYAVLPTPAPVVDVALLPARGLLVGYCADCTLHFWDIHEECLLQTIKIKFPFLGVLGKKIEFGTYSIHAGPALEESSEDEAPPADPLEPPLGSLSRRSSVHRGPSGRLRLPAEDPSRSEGSRQEDCEYGRFDRASLVVSCGDHVCVVPLRDTPPRRPRPPPPAAARARRPSYWDLPDDVMMPSPMTSPARAPSPPPPAIPAHQLLSPAAAEFPQHLDTLLENAGLQGILEKDFVLMQGLKHDLNKKLADMKTEMSATMHTAVRLGAPHLGLRCPEAPPPPPPALPADRYQRVMSLFPATSYSAPTSPSSAGGSTPRHRTSSRPA